MVVEEVEVLKKTGLMIYITEEEYQDSTVKEKIKEYKKIYKDVCTIISGHEPMEPVLRKMVELYCK